MPTNQPIHILRLIKTPPDGDDDGDGNLSVCDDRLSFDLKYDDDGLRHQNKNFAFIMI